MALHLLLQLVPGLATAWSGGSDAMPMPFPLPVNYSMGVCGNDPDLRPNCSTFMVFAINPTVHCSAKLGCSKRCTSSPLFQQAFSRYTSRLGSSGSSSDTRRSDTGPSGVITAVEVCVTDDSEELGAETDESYAVAVPAAATAVATVTAATIFGAMHGLETLTQLTDVRSNGAKTIRSAPVKISDAPRYSYRGLMIDSGRHFLPVAHIKRTIAAASMVKLNVIHWHMVDTTSFASCSKLYPQLCQRGAYPNNGSEGLGGPFTGVPKAVYSVEDLTDIVEFAKDHGVRVIPEWDVPGHGGWYMGMPELATSACNDALDVTRPELYDFLRAFLLEMGGIFFERVLSLGGDELGTPCFDKSPTIAAWMKARGLNASSTQQYFWQQMTAKVFPHLNKTVSVWRADNPDNGAHAVNLPAGSVMNVYQNLTTAWRQTIPAKIKTVVSIANQGWYLDGQGPGYNQNAWTYIYSFTGVNGSWLEDPTWSAEQRALFLGGETAIWSEGINVDNFDAYVWRGASAAAERLWATEQSLGCPAETCPGIRNLRPGPSQWLQPGSHGAPRLGDQLCRMSRMGVRTGPIGPGFCPSDGAGAAATEEVEVRQRLAAENAALKLRVVALEATLRRERTCCHSGRTPASTLDPHSERTTIPG